MDTRTWTIMHGSDKVFYFFDYALLGCFKITVWSKHNKICQLLPRSIIHWIWLTYSTCKWPADWSGAPSLICSAYCCHLSLQGKPIVTVIVCLWPLSCVLVAHGSIKKDRWGSTVTCNNLSEFHDKYTWFCSMDWTVIATTRYQSKPFHNTRAVIGSTNSQSRTNQVLSTRDCTLKGKHTWRAYCGTYIYLFASLSIHPVFIVPGLI